MFDKYFEAEISRLTKDFVENGIVRVLRSCFLLRTFYIVTTFIANIHLDIALRCSPLARWKVEAVFHQNFQVVIFLEEHVYIYVALSASSGNAVGFSDWR